MVQFASRMDLLKGSEIRELLKLTAQPDILSFAGGMPAPELFPVEQMMEASIAVLKEHGREALQYSTTEGFPRLREQIAERMLAKNNIHTDKDHILVTSGSQQGLDFSARVFLNPGDVVLLESPSYLGAVNAFKACEPKFIEVPTDDGGMIMDELEKILATTEQDLWDGYQMLREVSDLTGIPVSYTTGKKEFLDAFLARNPDPKYVGQPIPIDVYMHRDWDSYIEYGLNTKNPHKDMY